MKYQFQVRAANMAGVGIPSLPSDTFLCEEWTIAVPGLLDQWFANNSFFLCLYSISLEFVNVTTISYKTVVLHKFLNIKLVGQKITMTGQSFAPLTIKER